MKKKFIWIVLFVALVLLFSFLFLWPIQGSLYLNMNEDDGLNSSVYDLSTNRSKKVVIDDYNEVIDYYPLAGGYAAIGVNYVPAQNAVVDGLKSKYALVIHEGKRDFSYPLASSAGIMCVYEDTVYFTIYGEDDIASCYYKCNLSDFSIEKLPDSISDICSDGNTLVYVETLRDHDQVIVKQEGKENVAFSTDKVLCVDLLSFLTKMAWMRNAYPIISLQVRARRVAKEMINWSMQQRSMGVIGIFTDMNFCIMILVRRDWILSLCVVAFG